MTSQAACEHMLNEGAKILVGIAVAAVGIIWAGLDLAGYGPSQILESSGKSIQLLAELNAAI